MDTAEWQDSFAEAARYGMQALSSFSAAANEMDVGQSVRVRLLFFRQNPLFPDVSKI
ncbi:hypothetical protein J3R74_001008 [Puniceicoccus vermicola]